MYSLLVLTTQKSLEPPAILGRYCNFTAVASCRAAMDVITKQKTDMIISHFDETDAEYLRLAVVLRSLHMEIPQILCCGDAFEELRISAENLGIKALKSHALFEEEVVMAILQLLGLPCPADDTKRKGELVSPPSLVGSDEA